MFHLSAHPETTVHVRHRGVVPVRAHIATPSEREQLWPRLLELYADFADYQSWTERTIPVVILEPKPRSATDL